MREREPDNSLPPSNKAAGQNVMDGIHRKSYSEAVIEGVRKRARVFVGDSIVVCLPGAKTEAITEMVVNIVGSGKGRSVLVYVRTNNVEMEGTTATVTKYRNMVRTLKQTRVDQVILSGILPVIGRRGHGRDLQHLADHMTELKNFTNEENRGFSAFLLQLMLGQALTNLIVCHTKNYMQKLHKRASMLRWILGWFSFSLN